MVGALQALLPCSCLILVGPWLQYGEVEVHAQCGHALLDGRVLSQALAPSSASGLRAAGGASKGGAPGPRWS